MRDKLISITFLIFIFAFPILSLINKSEISYSERRTLATMPNFNWNTIKSKQFMQSLDNYVTDHFYNREWFRKIKASSNFYLFGHKTYNDLFKKDEHIFKLNDLSLEDAISFANKIKILYDKYLKELDPHLAIIPDKLYYLNNGEYLLPDYDTFYETLQDELPFFEFIELRDVLDLDSYYYTDPHWRQEKLFSVLEKLSLTMNFEIADYPDLVESFPDFYGAYYGQLGLGGESEELIYLDSDLFGKVKVNYLDSSVETIYNPDKINTIDPYEVYLNGATSYVTIENPLSNNDKELIIFRDSYASSLTPLLVASYKKITLIDLRYLDISYLDSTPFIGILNSSKNKDKDVDVLLLYSTLIIENHETLKIRQVWQSLLVNIMAGGNMKIKIRGYELDPWQEEVCGCTG